jgi:hypothetical protein
MESHNNLEESSTAVELPKKLLHTTKSDRDEMAKQVISSILDGDIDGLTAFIYASKGLEFFKGVVDNVRPIVASKQIQKGGIKLYDTEIIEKKNPDKYDFSVCSDSEWDKLNALLEDTKAKMKVRETFLKSLTEQVATMDGEIINPPSITYGAQNVALSLK